MKLTLQQKLEKQKLHQRIETLRGLILMYVDTETINYYKTQLIAKNPERNLQYRPVELTKHQIKESIQSMQWIIRDLEACISHLEGVK